MKNLFKFLFATFLLTTCVQAQNFTIQQYLSVKSASSPSISAKGDKIAFLSNITGTSQVFVSQMKPKTNVQLTNFEDNVSFVAWSPTDDVLIFAKARGGDENAQLFLMNGDGSGIRALTDDSKVRHNFGGWSDDGKTIFYASNKRDRNFFDVYSMDITSGKETLVLQQNGSNSFVTASKDGRKIIVSRSSERFSLDNDLYLVDMDAKAMVVHLTPHETATEYGEATFLDDGRVLLTTNHDGEFSNFALISFDQAGSPSKPMYISKHSWDVEGYTVSDSGKDIVFTLNREGFDEIYLRKLGTTAAQRIPMPGRGVVGGLQISGDGRLVVFSFASATKNSDVWSYDRRTRTLSQITQSDGAGIDPASFVAPQLIKFRTFDGRMIPAWYYRPKVRPGSTFPVIVSVHGGPEGQERPGFNGLYQYYLSRGYGVLATNVRGSTGYGKMFSHLDDVRKREDSVKDLAWGVRWLKTSGRADEKRIAVMGGSYGGYMTMAAVTLYPELWAAAVNTVGIVNWETFLKNTSGYRRRQREVEYGMLDKDLEFLRSISPIAKVDRIRAPLFVIHGKNDPRVPYTEAEQVVKALRSRGAIVEYKLFDDEGHGISKLKNRLELYPLVADFLDKHMK